MISLAAAPQSGGTVMVTDGDQRAALAVVRSLGRAGWRVVVVGSRKRSLAGVSRYCSRSLLLQSASESAGGFIEAMEAAVQEEQPDLIMPIAEASLFALSRARERFAGTLSWLPPDPAVRRVHDKHAVLEQARAVGLSVPTTEVAQNRAGLASAARSLGYPVVVKSHRSLVWDGPDRHPRKMLTEYADSEAMLARITETIPDAAFPLLLQRHLTGAGIGVFLLMWQGQICAAFMHRRIREKPITGGVSVARESIALRPDLVQKSATLLREMGWSGVAMIEFKEEAPGGAPQVLEINGRFWGSLQLAIDAGVDFPWLLARLARGEEAFAPPAYREGLRLRWEWGEVDHCLARLRRLGAVSSFPLLLRAGLRALGTLLVPVPGDRSEVLRLQDPLPFILESLNWFRRR